MKYLVACELDLMMGYEYEDLHAAIFEFDPDAVHLFGNLWLIETNANATQINDSLSKELFPGNKLTVTATGSTKFTGFGAKLSAWLDDQFRE